MVETEGTGQAKKPQDLSRSYPQTAFLVMGFAPATALYIKLGSGGRWERDCLEREQLLRVGFATVPHDLCASRDWHRAREELRRQSPAMATNTLNNLINQLRLFYESGDDVLWVTFYADRLWWCFSRPEVTQLPDGTKTRPAIDRWRFADLLGRPLSTTRLSGKLLSLQGYRGTICTVDALDYLVNKITGVESEEVRGAFQAFSDLEQRLETLVRRLHWKDFEILVDLIFRQAGWQRVGDAGGTQKTLDLDLMAPITGERYGVQIKSQARLADFQRYQSQFTDMRGFTRFYFAVHSPARDLTEAATLAAESFTLWLPATIAHLSLKHGLAEWIVDKAT